MNPLYQEASAARELIEALRQAGRDDDETVELSVASETDFKEVVAWGLRKIDEALALEAAAKAASAAADGRAKRFKARAERMRDMLRDALEMSGLPDKKLVLGEATLSLVPSTRSVVVADETAIPAKYWRTDTTRFVVKADVAKDLKANVAVPGCHLSNSRDTLAIRRA